MGTPRTSERLRLGESSVMTSSTEGGNGGSENLPLYQARMGGSTGRSSSRCLEGPGVGRWEYISINGTGMVNGEEQGNLGYQSADYLWS